VKIARSLSVLLANFLAINVLADTIDFKESQREYLRVGTISLGPTWNGNGGESQTFYLAPETEKTYAAGNSTNIMVDGELFLGLQKPLFHQLQGQLGFALAMAGNAKLSGNIWDDASPQFNNYTYQYKVMHTHVALKGKLLVDRGYWLIPWVSASAGVGFNRASDFSNVPTIFEAVPNANFSSHTTTSYTYTIGAGVQKQLNKCWQIGMGYEFADWGKSELGRANGQTMNSGLKLDHLYTNGILFNITYFA
jgi:opacity protein-like surface antigen